MSRNSLRNSGPTATNSNSKMHPTPHREAYWCRQLLKETEAPCHCLLFPTIKSSTMKYDVLGFEKIIPGLLTAAGLSFGMSMLNTKLYGNLPYSMQPDFVAAAKKVGPVSERIAAPPVFRNPMTNNIPGYIRGPEDLQAADQ